MIPGFHYGIYSCESCKGFFKRTVQNGKTFTCKQSSSCAVEVSNRKKCPACRYNKCRAVGMKVEGPIRPDRTRGGRSNYDGKSPVMPLNSSSSNITPHHKLKRPYGTSSLSSPEEQSVVNCCESRLSHEDSDKFDSLLHLADHCLYKIVKWARVLPEFISITTDDQILLLQNNWCELLFLNCCFHSMYHRPGLRVSKHHSLTPQMAEELGVEKVMGRLTSIVEDLEDMRVDEYEMPALKSMLLMSPDIVNLSNERAIVEHQDSLIDSLLTYSKVKHPNNHNRVGAMVTKLAELSRCSYVAKEMLTNVQNSGKVPQHSLLHELLKGDVVLH
ncbi:hypothetical protein HELRODRAFT_71280 [Helobdella robusta]|uniref:Uncharacterized protein n=1 Tax=Helobdella robusta TaxID=6412 RepID=T1G0I9_HELRO|nr:hypothetical protein HELRODRAFT_71280 [Helobdella robusta]ESO11590.1 hypothetical protein HELRODRAFT_71280 [Helobdella robusta]